MVLAEEAVLGEAQGQGQGLGLPAAGEPVGGPPLQEEDQVVPVGPHQGLAPFPLLGPAGLGGPEHPFPRGLLQAKPRLLGGEGGVDLPQDGGEAPEEAAPQGHDLVPVAGELPVPGGKALPPALRRAFRWRSAFS